MYSLSPNEPSKLLETTASLNAKKIRFEINKIQMPNGMHGEFGIIRHPGAALAVPITDDGQVIILRQYRFAIERRILEFPAGTLEKGEEPLATIKRELQEESGYKASKWNCLGQMVPAPGYADEIIHMFLARDLEVLANQPEGDADEDIEVLKLPINELNNLFNNYSEALDGKTITAWNRACQLLNL
tara:strand:- start:123 stop:683 length:561 start_codon:yes stop_codon:yes gene_type:complete